MPQPRKQIKQQIRKWEQRRADALAAMEPETHAIIRQWDDRKQQALDRLADRTAQAVARYDARIAALREQLDRPATPPEPEQPDHAILQVAADARARAKQQAAGIPHRPIHSDGNGLTCSLCRVKSQDAYAVGSKPEYVVCPACLDDARAIMASQTPIPGVSGYSATPDGLIYRTGGLRPLRRRGNSIQLSTANGPTCRSVPVLVLLAFAGNPTDSKRTVHVDGNRTNNRLENLKWA